MVQVHHQIIIIIHRFLIIEIYMIGVNVHGMSLIVVLKSVKVLVHIGGMQITGIMQLQEMAIELIIILL